MYMVIAPDHGGETLFASTVTAFERLSAEDQQLLVDLDTVNAPGSEVMPLQSCWRGAHATVTWLSGKTSGDAAHIDTWRVGFDPAGLGCQT